MISDQLSVIDWDYEFAHLNVNDMFYRFLQILIPLIEAYVPLKTLDRTTSPCPIKPPRELKRRRSYLWMRYKSQRATHGRKSVLAVSALENFLNCNFQYRRFALKSQSDYEFHLIDSLLKNPKVFHSYIRR